MSEVPSTPSSVSTDEVLTNMKAWSEAHPPRDGWQQKSSHVVHLRPHVRMHITFEQSEIGYALDRTEKLAEQGIFDAQLDSEQFACELMKAIGPDLSRRNLEDLIAEIKKAQNEWGKDWACPL